jgi:hypothetical protein
MSTRDRLWEVIENKFNIEELSRLRVKILILCIKLSCGDTRRGSGVRRGEKKVDNVPWQLKS